MINRVRELARRDIWRPIRAPSIVIYSLFTMAIGVGLPIYFDHRKRCQGTNYVHLSANISDFCVICRICFLEVGFLVRIQSAPTVFDSVPVMLPATRDIYQPPGIDLRVQSKSGSPWAGCGSSPVLAVASSRSPLTGSEASMLLPWL
ncbi:unnamed protein product [Nezara viridula]|uniref:Uncharacterized protein n=1 Tax=Nezara viridula TaxID=85310 RepID=A0A9P0MXB8_NEZVI|nr:unnamed protein product [Nezara viridula]